MTFLRRVPFKSKRQPLRREATQYEGSRPDAPRAPALRIVDTSARIVEPIEKPEKAKPGKRAPTVVEAKWMSAIVAHGCVACRLDGRGVVAPQVHHILRAGRRIGHLFTIPLCGDHHQDSGREGFVARHPWKVRFEKRYGTELQLLGKLKVELGFFDSWSAT